MGNVAYDINRNRYYNQSNIIDFDFKNKKVIAQEPVADDKHYDNRAGKKSEVYAFRTDEEIKAMIDVFNKHIEEAATPNLKRVACRDKMLFVIGINVGLRASDLRLLTWDFFFEKNKDGELEFREGYNLRPRKTSRYNKYVELRFNAATKKIINWYIDMYPIENLNDYVFRSRQVDEPITVNGMRRMIKTAAKEAGIKQNIGTHSLRKSFSRRLYDNAEDKSRALVLLQSILRHSNQETTLRYIGILNDEIEEAFDGINFGLDFI